MLLEHRTVSVNGVIEPGMASTVIETLFALAMSDAKAPVTLLVNSPGGELDQALAICDMIRAMVCPVQTVVVGWALSGAALIAACGTKGLRQAFPSARYMLHQTRSDLEVKNFIIKDHEAWVKLQKGLQDRTFALLAEVTGQPLKEIRKAAEWDHYLTASQAVGFGLADAIVERMVPVKPARKR